MDICQALRDCKKLEKIVYVSCNPRSCVDDVFRLCRPESKKSTGVPFKPIQAIGIDLFPHTEHTEMIIELKRCNDNEHCAFLNNNNNNNNNIQSNLIQTIQTTKNTTKNDNIKDQIPLDFSKMEGINHNLMMPNSVWS